MHTVSFYRPLLLLLIPCCLLEFGSAFTLFVAVTLDQPALLFLSALLLGLSVASINIWSACRYEVYPETTYNGRRLPPVLVCYEGVLNNTESYTPLEQLQRITIERPLRWRWCNGAKVTLYFAHGDTVELGLIGNATALARLLRTGLSLSQYLHIIGAGKRNTELSERIWEVDRSIAGGERMRDRYSSPRETYSDLPYRW